MPNELASLLHFLAILNPFALCLYLAAVMEDLNSRDFIRVFFLSSLISLVVFWVFVITGNTLLVQVLGVRPSALRVFGGVIFFAVGYNYVTKGYRATTSLRGSLDELPSAIALPYMIGAATITQCIIVGNIHGPYVGMLLIFAGVSISFGLVIGFKFFRDKMNGPRERVFDRYVNIFSRINGLIIGAISTEMIVEGMHRLWTNP